MPSSRIRIVSRDRADGDGVAVVDGDDGAGELARDRWRGLDVSVRRDQEQREDDDLR